MVELTQENGSCISYNVNLIASVSPVEDGDGTLLSFIDGSFDTVKESYGEVLGLLSDARVSQKITDFLRLKNEVVPDLLESWYLARNC
jgi:hypothetical protein